MQAAIPVCPLRLKKGREEEVRRGMPWIFRGDMIASSEHLLIPAGSLAVIENHKGERIGIGYMNPASFIVCRVLTLKNEPIDAAFFEARFKMALELREKRLGVPYYRLIHAETDGFPGLIIDRFGDVVVAQVSTAGMELLQPLWLAALEVVIAPRAIVLRNDTPAREAEGLKQGVSVLKGEVDTPTQVHENGFTYFADILKGQKTGWFYDQRDNRKMMAELADGKTVLDVYSHSGGFGLLMAKAGAARVTMADSSGFALELARKAAAHNGVDKICDYTQGDAFATMEKLKEEGRRYDIVLADPPAFVKSRKDIAAGMKGYEKIARMAAALVAPGGLLFIASCSHHAARSRFNQAVLAGVNKAGGEATILKQTGASFDHPYHPRLPQSEYLKGVLLQIDCQPL